MHICIFGDSWGCGEWGNDPITDQYLNTHRGLEQYLLEKGHDVTNLSKPSSSMLKAHSILDYALSNPEYKTDSIDLYFWFKTDPLRNFKPPIGQGYEHYFTSKGKMTVEDLIVTKDEQTDISYKKLNELGITIHSIGGVSKLNLDLMNKYSNLIPYIPSMIEFLIPDYEHPILCPSEWFNHVNDRQFDLESLDKLLDCKRRFGTLRQKHHTLFWPDGAHPNRYGHKILFEKICKDFNL